MVQVRAGCYTITIQGCMFCLGAVGVGSWVVGGGYGGVTHVKSGISPGKSSVSNTSFLGSFCLFLIDQHVIFSYISLK